MPRVFHQSQQANPPPSLPKRLSRPSPPRPQVWLSLVPNLCASHYFGWCIVLYFLSRLLNDIEQYYICPGKGLPRAPVSGCVSKKNCVRMKGGLTASRNLAKIAGRRSRGTGLSTWASPGLGGFWLQMQLRYLTEKLPVDQPTRVKTRWLCR